jgi:acyl carrier protein
MTRDEAMRSVATIFEEPAEKLRPETRKDAVAGWDSLGVLTLLAELDEKVEIQLGEKEARELKVVVVFYLFSAIMTLAKLSGVKFQALP